MSQPTSPTRPRQKLGCDELTRVFELLGDDPKTIAACCLLSTSLIKAASSVLYSSLSLTLGLSSFERTLGSASLPHNRYRVKTIDMQPAPCVLHKKYVLPNILELLTHLRGFQSLNAVTCNSEPWIWKDPSQQDHFSRTVLITLLAHPSIRELHLRLPSQLHTSETLLALSKTRLHSLTLSGSTNTLQSFFSGRGAQSSEYDLCLKVLTLESSEPRDKPLDSIANSLQRFKNLEQLAFRNGYISVAEQHLFSLISQLRCLKSLSLVLDVLYFKADSNPGLHLKPPCSLREVKFTFRSNTDAVELCHLLSWFIGESPLEVLNIWQSNNIYIRRTQGVDCDFLVDQIIEKHGATLESLILPECILIQRNMLKKLLKGCPKMEVLRIVIAGGRECLATFIRHAGGLDYLHDAHLNCRDLECDTKRQRWLISDDADEIMRTVKSLKTFGINRRIWKMVRSTDEKGRTVHSFEKVRRDSW